MRISDWSSDVCSSDLQLQAGDQAALDREYASPIERYREDVLKVGKNINDEMESVAVDGLTLLNNGLADVIANAKSLGDVFKGVADQIIAELADRKSTRLNSSH